jgi:16S rRNA (guanine(966)-N(2))-methyltransferase RsmD
MRILSGLYKGRNIQFPKHIRPTQDKVRKALFDILGDIRGLSFLELFAGSGAIGLEALSRGAQELVLVEMNSDCLMAIQKNIATFIPKACVCLPLDAEKAIKKFHKERRLFDIIFLDPPYYKDLAKKALQTLAAYDIVAPTGLVIVQHFKKDSLPQQVGDLFLFRKEKYGDTFLTFLQKGAVGGESEE